MSGIEIDQEQFEKIKNSHEKLNLIFKAVNKNSYDIKNLKKWNKLSSGTGGFFGGVIAFFASKIWP